MRRLSCPNKTKSEMIIFSTERYVIFCPHVCNTKTKYTLLYTQYWNGFSSLEDSQIQAETTWLVVIIKRSSLLQVLSKYCYTYHTVIVKDCHDKKNHKWCMMYMLCNDPSYQRTWPVIVLLMVIDSKVIFSHGYIWAKGQEKIKNWQQGVWARYEKNNL